MTTLQPRLVRADTLDLQSHESPSAKDHTRSPTYAPYTHGTTGPHHREALRNAEELAHNDRRLSPRVSMDEAAPNHTANSRSFDRVEREDDDEDDDDDEEEQHDGAQNEGEYEEGNEEGDDDLDDDMMDKISSSPSIEDEDIDFEFVYALHTFVATVEGQANATKGDTMVLLDDSNSYWWLVRVVKDGSIGYLPAEHIETPTERLARLNKHRNIDLSASMLGDNPEKSKNPLKKAMRRRNAKTVAFTAPTYYEPSEYDYDSEEDDEDHDLDEVVDDQDQRVQQAQTNPEQDGLHSGEEQEITIVNGINRTASNEQLSATASTSPTKAESTEMYTGAAPVDENLQRSRNGVVRNTDSFFKDDTAETKKISLTPRLLRNDTDSTASGEPEVRTINRADTFDKMLNQDDKTKEKEKEKEKKKKGMLSGLFKRKDKGAKSGKGDGDDEKDDLSRGKESLDSNSSPQSPERKPSKLQKAPPAGLASKNSPTEVRPVSGDTQAATSPILASQASESSVPTSATKEPQQDHLNATVETPRTGPTPNRFPSLTEKRSIFAPITTVLKSSSGDSEPSSKPVYSKRAKERFAIDVSDSEDDATPTASQVSTAHRSISPVQDLQPGDSRSSSAMEVSPVEPSDSGFHERDLTSAAFSNQRSVNEHDRSGHPGADAAHSDTASTSKPSPSLATHTPSTSRSTPTWSDASLRSYMDSDQDIRDLLIIVHDKSNVTPVGPDHPLMGGLFMTERTRLAEMQNQLDSMLTSWMSKKNPTLLTK